MGPDPPTTSDDHLIDEARRQVAALAGQVAPGRGAAVQPAMSLPQDSFAGYELLREVHRGGQGVIYQALQKSTGRSVAIKVLREGPFAGPTDKVRFEREVQVLGQLKHPHIVTIHDSGIAAGCHYFVMDYIPGQPLDVHMASSRRRVPQTLELFALICEAVNAAHLRGVIHRDLKPGNIRVDEQGQVHILDFGLAKMAAGDVEVTAMTKAGQFVGSLPWAAPEQAEGAPDKIDLRTDVYALGVILYQMLTGRFPYDIVGSMRDVLERIIRAEPVRPSLVRAAAGRCAGNIDGEVETIVLKCLAKDRERRYQSAGEVARDVRHYLADEPIEAKRDSTMYVLRKHLQRHRIPLVVGCTFVAVLLASSVIAWSLYVTAERARGLATIRLWDSYLAQARAGRASRRPGRRFESLHALRAAAAIRPTIELRNEAVACLALSDVQVNKTFPPPHGSGALAFTSGLQRYALGTLDGTITIHSAEDGREIERLDGPGLEVHILRFSKDGRFLAVKYHTNAAISFWVWDLDKREARMRIDNCDYVNMSVSPDSSWIALGASSRVELYWLASGQMWKTLGGVRQLHDLSVDPSGRRLAICGFDDPPLSVWDIDSGALVGSMSAPDGIWDVVWSHDGRLLAGTCEDHQVYVWDAQTGERRSSCAGHRAPAVFACFNQRGDLLASGGWDSTTRLWNPHSGEELIGPLLDWRLSELDGYRLAGWVGASVGVGRYEPVWECRRLVAAQNHEGSGSASIGPDNRLVATTGGDGLRLYDLASASELVTLSPQTSWSALFLPDGSGLVATVSDGLRYWPLSMETGVVRIGESRLWPQEGLGRACLGPDGHSVVFCNAEKLVVFDLVEWDERLVLPGYQSIGGPSVSPDFSWMVTGVWGGSEPRARVWDVQTGRVLREFPGFRISGTFSPDGRWLVIANPNPDSARQFEFYNTGTWELHHHLAPPPGTGHPGAVAFTPDGLIAALARVPFNVQLVEASTGRELATLAAPDAEAEVINTLAFSSEGSLLAVGSGGRITRVWDLARIRSGLRDLGLDWDAPELPPAQDLDSAVPLHVEMTGP